MNENEGRVILELHCRNKAEAKAAFDLIKEAIDAYGYNEEINEKVVVTNEGNPALREV